MIIFGQQVHGVTSYLYSPFKLWFFCAAFMRFDGRRCLVKPENMPFMREHLHWMAIDFCHKFCPPFTSATSIATHAHNGCTIHVSLSADYVLHGIKIQFINAPKFQTTAPSQYRWEFSFCSYWDQCTATIMSYKLISTKNKANVRCRVKRWLTCNCVSILLEPVICEFSLRKWAIKRLISFRFIPSSNDDGTKRSKPNSRLWQQKQTNKILSEKKYVEIVFGRQKCRYYYYNSLRQTHFMHSNDYYHPI